MEDIIKIAPRSTETTTPVVVESIQDFCGNNGFTQISGGVRMNTNNYPFLTFVNGENKAENIYFSKGAAALVTGDTVIDKEFVKDFAIGHTTNANGESRVKIVRASGDNRINLQDLF